MNLASRRVLIVGLGRSGRAAARLCAARGARVTVTDARPIEELAGFAAGLPAGVRIEAGGHRAASFREADVVVVSPGVPWLPEIEEAFASGVFVIGEFALARGFVRAPLVAITGTNGKSTVTALCGELLRPLGRPTFVGGNLGTPLSEAVDTPAAGPDGLVVAEASSFQLETIADLGARAAALLNLTPDHLDRYRSMAEYAAVKSRVFSGQTAADLAVCAADPAARELCAGAAARVAWLSPDAPVDRGGFCDGTDLVLRLSGREERVPASDVPMPGRHNLANALAALLVARDLGVPVAALREALRAFRPLPHRMQPLGEARGVAFYDDSKATNVASVVGSLSGFPRPVVLIAGGRAKGEPFAPLRALCGAPLVAAVLIGEARGPIAEALAGAMPVYQAAGMDDAVARAAALARPGDAVVLAPACASFDMFRDYADRGDAFARAARAWMAAAESPRGGPA